MWYAGGMTWIWAGTAWTMGTVGAGLLLWALFWDRPGRRGRAGLRCRGCWYDLKGTGVNEEGERASGTRPFSGVVCPECGKVHRGERAMRRTRRRWGWAVVAGMLLWAGWHGHSTRSAVGQRGLVAGVPGPVLVLPLMWMDARPGSVWEGDVNAASAFERAIAEEIPKRAERRMGVLTRWLVVTIGRGQDPAVITDGTTLRGFAFRDAVRRFSARGKLTPDQARWARGVVWAGFDTRAAWGEETSPHGVLRTRSLLGGPYRVGVVNATGVFEAGRDDSPKARWNMGTITATQRVQLLDQWSWDRLQRVRDEFWAGQTDTVVALVDDGFGSKVTVWFESADPYDALIAPGQRIATVEVPTGVMRDAVNGGPAVDSNAATGAWLTSSLRARLEPVSTGLFDGDWRAAVKLAWTGDSAGQAVTFGGQASVVLKRATGRDEVLMRGEGCWFRAEPVGPDGGSVKARVSRQWPRGGWSGAVVEDASRAIAVPQMGDRIVIRLEPEAFAPRRSVFADLETARVYLGVVELPLEGWTVEDVNRLRVSDVWPDGVME